MPGASSLYAPTPSTSNSQLTPKQQGAPYKQLFFVVDPSDWHVSESIVVDSNGDTNEFKFYAPNLKAAVGNSLFQVSPGGLRNYQVTGAQTPQAGAVSAGSASAVTTP